VIRLSYESMVSPASTYDFHVAERRLELLKVQEIPSGYDRSLYSYRAPRNSRARRHADPGQRDVPQGPRLAAPLHLYGYGAYGIAIDPGFSTTRLSLVDRGFAYAIAHIRGGDDSGARGTRPASSNAAPTPSPTSSTWRRGSSPTA
jgi:oligopeptidase B